MQIARCVTTMAIKKKWREERSEINTLPISHSFSGCLALPHSVLWFTFFCVSSMFISLPLSTPFLFHVDFFFRWWRSHFYVWQSKSCISSHPKCFRHSVRLCRFNLMINYLFGLWRSEKQKKRNKSNRREWRRQPRQWSPPISRLSWTSIFNKECERRYIPKQTVRFTCTWSRSLACTFTHAPLFSCDIPAPESLHSFDFHFNRHQIVLLSTMSRDKSSWMGQDYVVVVHKLFFSRSATLNSFRRRFA